MNLIEITFPNFDVEILLAYATPNNFTAAPIYRHSICYLHYKAAKKLQKSVLYAKALGYRLLIFDAFRPTEAQSILWDHTPDSKFLANPAYGSPHSRGVAVDLTLLAQNGKPLDMGTDFDSFTTKAHHGNHQVSTNAQKNRLILLGLMSQAGWDFYRNEWWHYQLHNSKRYPLFSNLQAPKPLL